MWSSQALCVSVFGTIAESAHPAALMQHIVDAAGVALRPDGEPRLCCEVRERRDVLNEIGGRNATCPDVLVEWPQLVLTIESKFTEHLGPCGQIQLLRPGGKRAIKAGACSGNHEEGSDLRTETDAACRLTDAENEGRRGYRSPRRSWEVGSRLFRPEVMEPPRSPCPRPRRACDLARCATQSWNRGTWSVTRRRGPPMSISHTPWLARHAGSVPRPAGNTWTE